MIIKSGLFEGNKRYYCGSVAGALDQAIRESGEQVLIIKGVLNKFGEWQEWKYVRFSLEQVKKKSKFNIFTKIDKDTGFMIIKTSAKG